MWRLIGVLIAVGLVAWLAARQLDGTSHSAAQAAATASRAAGVDDAVTIDPNASPAEVAVQVGQQIEASVAAGKARIDAFENAASNGRTIDPE
ncbi:MAG: hypothetical protein R3E75_06660 [Steroidobacteraceae bacterium]